MSTVIWKPEALNRLTTIWMEANDRGAVTAAVSRIDERLKDAPEDEGESRDDDRRVLFEAPLGVIFKVQPQDRMVTVLVIWRFETHGNGS